MSLLYHMKNLTYLRVSDHLDSKSTDNFSSLVLSSAWASIILASYRFCNLSNSTCKQLTHKHLTHLIISNKFHIFRFENILLVSFWGHSFFLHCKKFHMFCPCFVDSLLPYFYTINIYRTTHLKICSVGFGCSELLSGFLKFGLEAMRGIL